MGVFSDGRISYEGVSFPFGEGTPYVITGVSRGTAGVRSGDRSHPTRDGRLFGRDRKDGPDHEIAIAILGEGASSADRETSARALVGDLARVWNAPSVRGQIASVAELAIGDRSAIGRPRELTPDDTLLWDGTAQASLKFAAVNDIGSAEALVESKTA